MSVSTMERTNVGEYRRYDVFLVDLGKPEGSVQGGIRPCIITSNNKAGAYSPVITVSPLTTSATKAKLPTHVYLKKEELGVLERDSMIQFEQHISIPKTKDKFLGKLFSMPEHLHKTFDRAIMVSHGIM